MIYSPAYWSILIKACFSKSMFSYFERFMIRQCGLHSTFEDVKKLFMFYVLNSSDIRRAN